MIDRENQIEAYLDGWISDKDAESLEAWIAESDEHARQFVAMSMIHADIHDVLRAGNAGGPAVDEIVTSSEKTEVESDRTALLREVIDQERVARIKREAEAALSKQQQETADAERRESMLTLLGRSRPNAGSQTRHYVIPRPLFYGSIAAMIAVVAAIMIPVFQSNMSPLKTPQPVAPQFFEVATLVEEFEAKWERGAHRIEVGEAIFNERIKLTEGFAKLRFRNQAEVILEAPCEMEPVSESEVRIIGGKFVGACRTDASKGFTVRANNARIVDLGTEFGVSIADDGTLEAHVIEGEIAMTPLTHTGPHSTVSLKAGDGRRVSPDASVIERIEVDQFRFVRGMDAQDRDPMRGYVAAVKALNPVVYYRFESLEDQNAIVNDMGSAYRARIVGDVTLEDIGQGKAARFSASGRLGYVRLRQKIEELAGTEQYTFECWVNPDEVRVGSLLSMNTPEGGEQQVLSTSGLTLHGPVDSTTSKWNSKLRFIHRSPPARTGGMEIVWPEPYRRQQWIHIVAVKNETEARLYVNGKRVATEQDTTAYPDIDFVTRIGGHIPDGEDGQTRQFAGLIDEVAIYDHALNDSDIAKHYQHMVNLLVP